MDKKVIIIPDVHGRTFWKDAIPYIEGGTPVVFLGDYLDPYSHEAISPNDAKANFKEILEVTEGKNNVHLLIGNHDTTYIWPEANICECRTDYNNLPELCTIFKKELKRFSLHWYDEVGGKKFLFTHAGVHEDWLKVLRKQLNIKDDADMGYCLTALYNGAYNEDLTCLSLLSHVSYLRGGWQRVGSCIWADINEFLMHPSVSLKDYTQIVGHSQQIKKQPTENGGFKWVGGEPVYDMNSNVFCLDCHKCFYIDGEGDVRYLANDEVVE